MPGEKPRLAVDNTDDPDKADPTNGNGKNGSKLRSDFHQLELGMERLRADVVSEVANNRVNAVGLGADLKTEAAHLSAKIAEAKVSIITVFLIALGVSIGMVALLIRL